MKLTYLSFLVSILLGGVITGNILGDMKNKSAEIVFFVWKGIQVFRKRVIPSNPKSVAQTAQRLRFSQIMKLGLNLLTPVLSVYWKRFAVKKSEINAFVQRNLRGVLTTLDPADTVIIDGQASCGVAAADTSVKTEVVIDPLGTGFIDPGVYTKTCGLFYNVITGEIGICEKRTTSLVSALTFTNPFDSDAWVDTDWGFALWFEKPTIVDAMDFTNSQIFTKI